MAEKRTTCLMREEDFHMQWQQFSPKLDWITYCQQSFLWPPVLSGYPIWIPVFVDVAFVLYGKTPGQIQILPCSIMPLPSGTTPLKKKPTLLTGFSFRVLTWQLSFKDSIFFFIIIIYLDISVKLFTSKNVLSSASEASASLKAFSHWPVFR